ncbi:WD40 repeat domain-containing serine/threonine protein kinase [Paludisphaera borealis]|uniref:Serine/threonine-protein kinase StkP n=1 Tax=Paludisphaera borealis TaxID=1387353 RepID=A0A1U7CPQ9_9BACT|nr:protein kinase [Paludisphaera borealis]APW60899.1 Serine/threonine-protein kinase StkP [Paludisphaera borealis]
MNTISRPDGHSAGYRDACVELKGRLRSGEPARVEDLLAGNPNLAGDHNAVLELILAEVATRSELGEKPSVDEWEHRISLLIPDAERRISIQNLLVSEMVTLSESSGAEGALDRDGHTPMTRIGKYQILEEIGRGGMGIVYKARQTNLNRIVALKMILTGEHADRHERGRLRKEAEATATLDHPNIVKIFDIGEHEGMPYLEMEFVSGGNLTRMLRSMPQPIRWAARLTETLARAIHVAHERGIVHRDLNPSNILMTTDGIPKITDFGLAKFLLSDAGLSQNGMLLGTPPYMAPEQVSGGKEVGPGTDVYAIGVMLYEMLTGAPPFRGLTPMETLCQVMEGEVVPPSRLRHGLPIDIETICLKCLARSPGQRYDDAEELAEDLRRFQNREAIRARRTPRLRRAAQWARREPLAAGFLGLSFLLLLTLLVVAGGYSIYLHETRGELQKQMENIYSHGWMSRQAKAKADRDDKEAKRQRYDAQLSRAYDHEQRNEPEVAIEIFDVLKQNLPENTGFEFGYVDSLIHRSEFLLSGGPGRRGAVDCATVSGDGRTVASGDRNGRVFLWDVPSQASTPYMVEGGRYPIREVALASDATGKAVAIAAVSLGEDKTSTLSIWDESKPSSPWTFRDRLEDTAELAFSLDGKLLALRCRPAPESTWETRFYKFADQEWSEDAAATRQGVTSQRFAPGANLLALGTESGTVVVIDLDANRGDVFSAPKSTRPVALAFSSDRTRIAAGCEDRSIVVWDLASRRVTAELNTPDGPPKFLGFCNGDKSLVVSEGDTTLAVHSLRSPSARRVLPTRGSAAIALSRRGDRLAVGGDEEPVSLWNLEAASDDPQSLGKLPGAKRLIFSPDGQFLFMTFHDPLIRVWRMAKAPHPWRKLAGHSKEAWAVAFSRDGKILASGADDLMIKLWDVATGDELAAVAAHSATVAGLAFSPVSDELASVGLDGAVKLWSLSRDSSKPAAATLKLSQVLREPKQSQLRCVAYSSNGSLLAASGLDPEIHVWDAASREPLHKIKNAHRKMITALAYSPTNPRQLASASCDAEIKIWDMDSGDRIATSQTNGALMALAYSPSGHRLATSGQPRLIASWDTTNRNPLDDIIGHPDAVRSIAFSTDGQTVATGCDDGKIRLCDQETNQVVLILDGHHARINSVTFSPDGYTLASCSHSGEVFLWNARRPEEGPGPPSAGRLTRGERRTGPRGQAETAPRR